MHGKEKILQNLEKLGMDIEINWDRVIVSESDNTIMTIIYGWTETKSHGKVKPRDFILYLCVEDLSDNFFWDTWTTSSAKFSKKFAENWGSSHNPCIKFDDWLKINGDDINNE